MSWAAAIQAGGQILGGLAGGGLFGGGGYKMDNPRQLADEQYNRNLAAARDSYRFSNYDQYTPWGTSIFTGKPGSPGYRQDVTLNPADQALLDERRALAQQLTDIASFYMVPQVGRAFSQPLSFGNLPGVPMTGDIGLGQITQRASNQGPVGAPKGGGQGAGASNSNSYLTPGESPTLTQYRKDMEQFRKDSAAYNEAMANRELVLPDRVGKDVIIDYFSATNPDKYRDIDRWMNDQGLDTGAKDYALEDINRAARAGFSGASERSRMILNGLPGYLETWAHESGEYAPLDMEKPVRPTRPSATELYPVQGSAKAGPTQQPPGSGFFYR